jgi:hypothetical protein
MTGPPFAPEIDSDLAANQGPGIPLLSDRYDALDAAGRRLFTVSREKALEGIASGAFEPVGRTCVKYLRINSAADPARSARHSAPKTWYGPPNPGRGARAIYDHNVAMCGALGPDPRRDRRRLP